MDRSSGGFPEVSESHGPSEDDSSMGLSDMDENEKLLDGMADELEKEIFTNLKEATQSQFEALIEARIQQKNILGLQMARMGMVKCFKMPENMYIDWLNDNRNWVGILSCDEMDIAYRSAIESYSFSAGIWLAALAYLDAVIKSNLVHGSNGLGENPFDESDDDDVDDKTATKDSAKIGNHDELADKNSKANGEAAKDNEIVENYRKQRKELLQNAIDSVGYDIRRGHIFWNSYCNEEIIPNERLIELAVLPIENIDRLKAVEDLEKRGILPNERLKRLRDASKNCTDLSTKLSKLQDAADRIRKVGPPIDIFQHLLDMIATIEKHKLVQPDVRTKLEIFLLEQAEPVCGSLPGFWGCYIDLCISRSNYPRWQEDFLNAAIRATEIHPLKSEFWIALLQCIEHKFCNDWTSLVMRTEETIQRAASASWGNESADSFAGVLMASCDAYRRHFLSLKMQEQPNDEAIAIRDHILRHYVYVSSVLRTLFPRSGPSATRLACSYAEFTFLACKDTGFDSLSKTCHQIWDLILTDFPHLFQAYQQAALFFERIESMDYCRKIFKRGLHKLKSLGANDMQSHRLGKLWLEIESRHGNLQTIEIAQKTTSFFKRFNPSNEPKKSDSERAPISGKIKTRKSPSLSKEDVSDAVTGVKGGKATETSPDISYKEEVSEKESSRKRRKIQDPQAKTLQKRGRPSMDETNRAVEAKPITKGSKDSGCKISSSIFVSNLSFDASAKDIVKFFKMSIGPVAHCRMKKNPYGGFKGCAVVEFKHSESALKALDKMKGTEFMGRALEVRPFEDVKNVVQENDGKEIISQKNLKTGIGPSDTKLRKQSVFLGNIPPSYCSVELLKSEEGKLLPFFETLRSCGTISDVYIAKNRSSAVATFSTILEAQQALKLHGQVFSWPEIESRGAVVKTLLLTENKKTEPVPETKSKVEQVLKPKPLLVPQSVRRKGRMPKARLNEKT